MPSAFLAALDQAIARGRVRIDDQARNQDLDRAGADTRRERLALFAGADVGDIRAQAVRAMAMALRVRDASGSGAVGDDAPDELAAPVTADELAAWDRVGRVLALLEAEALFGALVLLALVGRLIWRRRSTSASAPETFEPPVAAPAEPAGLRPPAEPRPEVAPEPTAVEQDAGLAITLEALRLDVSLVAATLSYQLTLSNRGGAALSALAIEGDLVAAHASLPVEQQIANTEQRLELRHALVELAPGGVAEFRGELRLPLTAITPIRAGNAAYFVPLARLRIEAAQRHHISNGRLREILEMA